MKKSIKRFICAAVAVSMCWSATACRRGGPVGANHELSGVALVDYLEREEIKTTLAEKNVEIHFDPAAVDEKSGKIKAAKTYKATEHYFENDEEIQKAIWGETVPLEKEIVDNITIRHHYKKGDDEIVIGKKNDRIYDSGLTFWKETGNPHADNVMHFATTRRELGDTHDLDVGIRPTDKYRVNVDLPNKRPYLEWVNEIEDIFKKIGIDDVEFEMCNTAENERTIQLIDMEIKYQKHEIEWLKSPECKVKEEEKESWIEVNEKTIQELENNKANLTDESTEGYGLLFSQTVDSIPISTQYSAYLDSFIAQYLTASITDEITEIWLNAYLDIGDSIEKLPILNSSQAMEKFINAYRASVSDDGVEVWDMRLLYCPFKDKEKDEYTLKPVWMFYVYENGSIAGYAGAENREDDMRGEGDYRMFDASTGIEYPSYLNR